MDSVVPGSEAIPRTTQREPAGWGPSNPRMGERGPISHDTPVLGEGAVLLAEDDAVEEADVLTDGELGEDDGSDDQKGVRTL